MSEPVGIRFALTMWSRRLPARGLSALQFAMTSLVALPAGAQRTDDNAVTAAGDAFGVTVGFQTIGLYGPINVRGFNPAQAENLRIEGLYYDQQLTYSNPFLFSRSDIRVGIAAQSYSFPSPTGIVDYKLRIPGDTPLLSVLLTRGPLNMVTAEVDAQSPLVEDLLSAGVSVAHWNNFDYNYARTSESLGFTLLLRIRPDDRSEIVPFVGYTHNGEHHELPSVYASGINPLPAFNEQQLAAQDWTSWGWNQLTAGVIGSSALGSYWRLTAGVFRSLAQDSQNFNDLLLSPTAFGIADHIVDTPPPLRAGSYSGDLRVTRRLAVEGAHEREVTFDVRGRTVERDYGGDSVLSLGSTSIYHIGSVPAPLLAFSAQSLDEVHQVGVGANYNERWTGVGTLSLGVLETEYRRTLDIPGLPGSTERTSKALPTASFTAEIGKYATSYASYTRGLEDSVSAPTSAVNRGEPVPATPTWQVDGGLRVVPRSELQLLLGVFKIHKVYFNVNSAGLYRQLGDISSRGVEGSATLSTLKGLKVVAGLVLLRPEVNLQTTVPGAATVPVGPVPRTINVNIDYAPARWGHWAAALQWTSLSSRVVTNNDQIELPPLSTLNVSVRYNVRLFNRPCSARLDVANVTDQAGLTISSLYAVLPVLRRNYTLTLATDI